MSSKVLVGTLVGCIVFGIIIGTSYVPKISYYENTTKTRDVEVQERTKEIYNSGEFVKEMNALATARALFELSNEVQDGAVELSEMAIESYNESQIMAENWHQKQSE